jgi:hypothetical protein
LSRDIKDLTTFVIVFVLYIETLTQNPETTSIVIKVSKFEILLRTLGTVEATFLKFTPKLRSEYAGYNVILSFKFKPQFRTQGSVQQL